MQTFAQKHYQWLFGLLLIIIIASFIFAYGPASNLVHGKAPWHQDKLYLGYDLNDASVVRTLSRDAAVGYYLKNGYPVYDQTEFRQLIFQRIVELNLADSLGVPSPSTKQLGLYMANLPAFKGTDGLFSRKAYDALVKQFADEGGEDFLSGAIAERWRLDQVEDSISSASYYLPQSLQREAALRSARYTVVNASIQNTLDVSVDDAELESFFKAHQANYMTSETREGIYYSLSADQFLSRVKKPDEDTLKTFFDKNSMQFLQWQKTDENGKVTGDTPHAPTYEENADKVWQLYKQQKAARMAAEVVDEVVSKIYTDKIASDSTAWDELLKASGLTATPINAVAADGSIKGVPDQVVDVLFSLTSQEYSGAFQTDDAGGFVLRTQIHQPTALSLAQAHDQALADAKADKAATEFQKQATEVTDLIKKATSLEQFKQIAQDHNWTIGESQTFSLTTPPAELKGHIKLLQSFIRAKDNDVFAAVDPKGALASFVTKVEIPKFSMQDADCRDAKASLDKTYSEILKMSELNQWGILKADK